MIVVPECFQCKHYSSGKCPAYPNGIPKDILAESKEGKKCSADIQYVKYVKKRLSEKQLKMIDAIKEKWMAEIEALPDVPYEGARLDGGGGRYREIEKKYVKMIREIMEKR